MAAQRAPATIPATMAIGKTMKDGKSPKVSPTQTETNQPQSA